MARRQRWLFRPTPFARGPGLARLGGSHDRQVVEVIEVALNDLILALGHDTRWRYREPSTKQVDRKTIPRAHASALIVMSVEGVELPRTGAYDYRRTTVAIECIGEHAFLVESTSSTVIPFRGPA